MLIVEPAIRGCIKDNRAQAGRLLTITLCSRYRALPGTQPQTATAGNEKNSVDKRSLRVRRLKDTSKPTTLSSLKLDDSLRVLHVVVPPM